MLSSCQTARSCHMCPHKDGVICHVHCMYSQNRSVGSKSPDRQGSLVWRVRSRSKVHAKCKPKPMGRVSCLRLQVAGRVEVSSCRSSCSLHGPQLQGQPVLSGEVIRHVSLGRVPC